MNGNVTPRRSPTLNRIQRNLLASAERRLLTWLCSRMPTWITPDVLTAAGLAGALAVLAGYAASAVDHSWLWLAIIGYVLHWFGDSLDGSLARYRQIERPSFGYFVDHSCDGLATLLILAGMGLSPFVRLDVALLALAGYLLLSVHAFLSARVLGELRLSYVAAGPTELRLILIAFTLAMFFVGTGPRVMSSFSTYDVAVTIAAMALITLFVFQTVFTARRIAAKEHAGQL